MTEETVSPEDLYERLRRGDPVNLLDVRNRDEAEAWPLTGPSVESERVTYAEFMAVKARGEAEAFVADLGLDEPIVAVCPRGEASASVAELLREQGLDARNLESGMEGWARVYADRELPADATPEATVLQYDRPATGCLGYLVVSGDEAAVIDPLRAFADRYVADAEDRGAQLRYAIDTHVHADHLSGVQQLASDEDVEPVLPTGATDRGLAFDATLLADGDELAVGDATLTALHAPGHTTELTAFRLGDVLFSGDALFTDSFGRPDLERGDEGAGVLAGTLHETLTERLLALPEDLLVAPGHRTPDETPNPDENETYTARIGDVRDRLDVPAEKEAFVSGVLESLPPRPANFEAIIPANLGREAIDDDSAFEIELGPNNCAVTTAAESD
ncbi:MBL fold metallo-hydrolase [Halorussus lipolyticus]|uniref:MBL fold metallo-hydrolase n=1 Tax=Halorussus lipolyticus TaxID=3034024 RepID=UPI0023E76440|nr:MBL fold metallo-hydrolase [Halorussus sp. DT80]